MNKLDIKELQNRLDAISEAQVNEDSYDHTSDDGHQIKDVTDYDDYDGYSVKLETPLGSVEAEWNSQGGRGFFGGIRASNRTLESMIGKIYGEMHDFESMDKMDWPVAVGMAVDKVMSMAKDNPSFMRSESVEKVNEYYVKSAEDVLNTYPLFSYRKSNPSVDTLYKSFQKWLATGNELTPDQIEALDQAASAPEFIGLRGGAEDDQEVIDMLNSGLDTLEDIIGDKTESVQEGDAELEELKSALGRTGGVMGFKN